MIFFAILYLLGVLLNLYILRGEEPIVKIGSLLSWILIGTLIVDDFLNNEL